MPLYDVAGNKVRFDVDAIRAGAAQLAANNNITTDAQWSAFIDGRTDAQLLQLLRNYFKTLIKIEVTGP